MRLRYFGIVGDKAGRKDEWLLLPTEVATGRDLREYLVAKRPELADVLHGGRVRLAVNQQIASWDTAVCDTDEIAFLPPMSGG